MDFDQELKVELNSFKEKQSFRKTTPLERVEGAYAWVDGSKKVNWASNDYLGLSLHPRVREAACDAVKQWGAGARAARLLSGSTQLHHLLEACLADFFGVESALLFSSGYLANLGVLQALPKPEDTIFLDRLAHASLVDGARASQAQLRVFPHNDCGQLKRLLDAPLPWRKFIVTEGLFSMDGDRAPVADLLELAHEQNALLYIDDAHGAFIEGAKGRGVCEPYLGDKALITMATFGKALGGQGAAVLGSQALTDYLVNTARTFLFETAPAIPVVAAAMQALEIVSSEPDLRERVHALSERLHAGLTAQGLQTCAYPSVIAPVILGSSENALKLSQSLWASGHWCPAIRPPTVKAGSSRLRLSVTAAHTEEQVDALLALLKEHMHA